MPSAAQDGDTVVTDDIVVIIDVVGTVVAVTMVGIMVGVSHGSACVVQAGTIVEDVFHDSVGICSVDTDRLVGDRLSGAGADIETVRLPPRRFSNNLCRSSANVPSTGRLLFINSLIKPSLDK